MQKEFNLLLFLIFGFFFLFFKKKKKRNFIAIQIQINFNSFHFIFLLKKSIQIKIFLLEGSLPKQEKKNNRSAAPTPTGEGSEKTTAELNFLYIFYILLTDCICAPKAMFTSPRKSVSTTAVAVELPSQQAG